MKMRDLKKLLVPPVVIVSLLVFAGCTGAPSTATTTSSTSTGPGGGTIVRNDSIVECQIKAFGMDVNGLTEMDVLIISSENVDDIANETLNKVNTIVTVRTDEKLSAYVVGDYITAHIKLAGDVEHGTYLNMTDIKPAS